MEQEEDLLTVQEVARRLRVDEATVRRWIAQGALEAIKLPRAGKGKRQLYRVRKSVVDAMFRKGLGSV